MRLINISNKKRKIFLFCRNDEGKQVIVEDEDFFSYYFEPDNHGEYKAIDGQKLKKIFCTEPGMVRKQRSNESYEADIVYTRRYMIDKIEQITPVKIKWSLIDIEVKAKEFPNVKEVKYPVSCISVYNNFTEKIKTFWLPDYDGDERKLFNAFIDYMEQEKFDMWMSWNVKFDYCYLYNRYKKLFGKRADFARAISPIKQGRRAEWGKLMNKSDEEEVQDIWFPSGISIIDLMQWFKKLTLNKRKSYALDYIAQEDLKEESCGEMEFGTLNEEIKIKNINDVNRMLKLEKKFNIIQYFDEIRKLSKVEWEDLYHNSRILDMLCLQEAKKRDLVLPTKQHNEKEEYKGAFREALQTGAFFNIGKVDMGSAYPSMIKDFCLDPVNLRDKPEDNTIAITIKNMERDELTGELKWNKDGTLNFKEGNTYYYKQNSDAILPTVVRELLEIKTSVKALKKNFKPNTPEFKIWKSSYEAIKSVVNSSYGVMGNRFFRLYDKRIAETVTFLVRDALYHAYIRIKIEKGLIIIYIDTDGIFYNSIEDISKWLNEEITKWGKKYNNDKVTLEFEYEGYYNELIILAKCRYKGWLQTDKGIEIEVKGIEAKRNDSTEFMKIFQTNVFEKIREKKSKVEILKWIKSEIERVKILPLEDIAFPCKMNKPIEKYKNIPIWARALVASPLKKRIGELYYYIYIKPIKIGVENEDYYLFKGKNMATKTAKEFLYQIEEGTDFIVYRKKKILPEDFKKELKHATRKRDIITNVMAFDKNNKDHVSEVDYNLMIQRNVTNKCQVIFDAMKWNLEDLLK